MNDTLSIVEFPLEDKKQAETMAKKLLEKDLAVVVRVYSDVFQYWKEETVEGSDVVILRCRVESDKVDELYDYVKANHPWPVFCFDVLESHYRGV